MAKDWLSDEERHAEKQGEWYLHLEAWCLGGLMLVTAVFVLTAIF